MAQYTAYMNYTVYFTDPAEYNFAISIAGGNFLEISPRDAATMFGIPFPYPTGPIDTVPKGIIFYYPYIPGAEINHPQPSGIFVNDAVSSQLVPGQSGNPASVWPPGPDVLLVWSASILMINNNQGIPDVTPLPQRRWIGGRELQQAGEGAISGPVAQLTRSASRTIDGFGLAIRGQNSSSWTRDVTEYRPGLTPKTSWERFYVRIRVPGTADCGIWRCHGFPSASAGCGLKVSTTSQLDVYNISAAGVEVLKGSASLPVDEWVLIDILLKYDSGGGTDGRIKVFINHVLAVSYTVADGLGMNQNSRHTRSDLGRWTAAVDNQVEIDLDDWMCADIPSNVNAGNLAFNTEEYSIDWVLGSHIRVHYIDPLTLTSPNWTGSPGVVNQGLSPASNLTTTLTSTTSAAEIEGETDAVTLDIQDTLALVFGAASGLISDESTNAGSTDGQLGYRKAGAAAVFAVIDQTAVMLHHGVPYFPNGMITPDEISPWSLVKQKSADANLDTTRMLMTIVEYIGVWGPEDEPNSILDVDRLTFLHNCQYTNTVWGYIGPNVDAPVYAIGGLYTGNGTYQEINLPAPCHFVWIRPISGAPTGGIKWFGASVSAHLGGKDRCIPNFRAWTDILGQARFSVHGNSIECNLSATTYQYIAFCDPGMRFNLCGAFQHPQAGATSFANLLTNAFFLPEGGFAQSDLVGSVSNATGLWYKGPGSVGTQGSPIPGSAVIPDFGSFSAGLFTSGDSIVTATAQVNYSLWRSSEPICSGIMAQMFSYTGDGTASRVIDVTPAGGRFPLFVLVIPSNAPAVFRDPSHAAAASSNADTLAAVANGIIDIPDVDQITVGITLNSNGIVYNVFIIPGSDVGMVNGIFFNPNCSSTRRPPNPVEGINVLGDGGLSLNGQPPFLVLKDASGIYTLIPNQRHDTLMDRQTGQASVEVKIPNPTFKTGYVGG